MLSFHPVTEAEEASWRTQYQWLVVFRREIRHRWPSPSEHFPPGNPLGAWCARQNRMFRQNRLPARFIRQLLRRGFPLSLGKSPWKPEQESRLRKYDKLLELFLWWYRLLRKFRKAHPDRWPKHNETFAGPHALGQWLVGIRGRFRRKRLPPFKITLLERLGYPLQGPFALQWERQYAEFKDLLARHPQDWRHTAAGRKLYQWVARQRTYARRGELTPDQAKRLSALGAGFPARDRWGDGFRRLADYRKRHPDRWPAGREKSPDGFLLGKWCTGQRMRYRLGKLKPEQIRKLTELGFPFRAWLQEAEWMEQYGRLQVFRRADPGRWPDNTEEFPPGNPLGKWCAYQRWGRERGRLIPGRIKLLDRIGFPWGSVKDMQWAERFGAFAEWRRHAGRWPKNNAVDPHERTLAQWVGNQKQFWKRGQLTKERLRKLRDLGLDW